MSTKIRFPSFIEKLQNKNSVKLLRRLYDISNIRNIYKVEDELKIPVLSYIVGDIEYEGPKKLNLKSARDIYPYVNKFFDINHLIGCAVNDYNFWKYIYIFMIKKESGANTKENAKD